MQAAYTPPIMLGSWFLLLLMLPGWLLPSGLRFSTCRCVERAAAASTCCGEVAPPACCGDRSEESGARNDAPSFEPDRTCGCFVALPDHEGKRALTVDAHTTQLPDAARVESHFAWIPLVDTPTRAVHVRAHGPSPGGPIPLPLRV